MSRKKKFIIAGLVAALLIVGVLVYLAFGHGGGSYLSVTQLKTESTPDLGRNLQVRGEVETGSVKWDPINSALTFTVSDEQNTLDVIYRGVAPDAFKPGADIVLAGRLTGDGSFEAQSMSAPSSALCNICH